MDRDNIILIAEAILLLFILVIFLKIFIQYRRRKKKLEFKLPEIEDEPSTLFSVSKNATKLSKSKKINITEVIKTENINDDLDEEFTNQYTQKAKKIIKHLPTVPQEEETVEVKKEIIKDEYDDFIEEIGEL